MKVTKEHYDGQPIEFAERPEHEQRLMLLLAGINGNYKTDYTGVEKAMSIRFSGANYPKVKALSELSGNSLNVVVNDLVEVAYGVLMANASEESADTLFKTECLIRDEWFSGKKTETK